MNSPMDVQLPPRARRRWSLLVPVGVVLLGALFVAYRAYRPAAAVDRASVVIARVERKVLQREANGTGTLIPARSMIIVADTAGRVDSILALAGQETDETAPIVLLSNPEVVEAERDARASLALAQAERNASRAQLEQAVLALRAESARLEGEAAEAEAYATSLRRLAAEGLSSSTELNVAIVRETALTRRAELARQSLRAAELGAAAQIEARSVAVTRAEARYATCLRAVDGLRVRSRFRGIVQEVAVEVGQRVGLGDTIAKVTDPSSLLARLRLPPVQAGDVTVGQAVRVDTHVGLVRGRVARIDPSVRDGSVAVDVALQERLPTGVRPDSQIEGAIELSRVDRALVLRRPANVADGSTVELFCVEHGNIAQRRTVSFGRGSSVELEVLRGLEPGDEVIVSETTPWQDYRRLEIR